MMDSSNAGMGWDGMCRLFFEIRFMLQVELLMGSPRYSRLLYIDGLCMNYVTLI